MHALSQYDDTMSLCQHALIQYSNIFALAMLLLFQALSLRVRANRCATPCCQALWKQRTPTSQHNGHSHIKLGFQIARGPETKGVSQATETCSS